MNDPSVVAPPGSEHRLLPLTFNEQQAEARAKDLLVFSEGIADVNPELARRSRLTALDLLDLLFALADERSARQSIQRDRDRILALRFPGAYGP